MNRNRKHTKYFVLAGAIIIIVLLLILSFALKKTADDRTDGAKSGESTSEAVVDDKQLSDESPLAVLFCASDYQIEDGWDTPANNLSAILGAISSSDYPGIDALVFCGDYTNDRKLHDYQISPEDSIAEIKGIAKDKIPGITDDDMLFVQGNHDALTGSIAESGLHEFDDYLVYVLNTENDFPWKQGKTSGAFDKVRVSSAALRRCLSELAEKGESRPVIIAGHVPLHFTARTSTRHTTGDNLYASLIFEAVNEAAGSLDIIYLYGHNHSKGWDCYMGGSSTYKAPGDTLLVPEFNENSISTDDWTEETLKFTYLNAGYTGYYMNCGPVELDDGTWETYNSPELAADCTLTGTTLAIYSDRIEITRWDEDGVHDISAAGKADPYQGGIDKGLFPESEYAEARTSPQVVHRH